MESLQRLPLHQFYAKTLNNIKMKEGGRGVVRKKERKKERKKGGFKVLREGGFFRERSGNRMK
jgi:hypothetical protein